MLERVCRKENCLTMLVGMQTGIATLENSVDIPQKAGNKTAIKPSNPTSGHTPQGNQSRIFIGRTDAEAETPIF